MTATNEVENVDADAEHARTARRRQLIQVNNPDPGGRCPARVGESEADDSRIGEVLLVSRLGGRVCATDGRPGRSLQHVTRQGIEPEAASVGILLTGLFSNAAKLIVPVLALLALIVGGVSRDDTARSVGNRVSGHRATRIDGGRERERPGLHDHQAAKRGTHAGHRWAVGTRVRGTVGRRHSQHVKTAFCQPRSAERSRLVRSSSASRSGALGGRAPTRSAYHLIPIFVVTPCATMLSSTVAMTAPSMIS